MSRYELTDDVAYLIGVYMSDGCVSKHSQFDGYRFAMSANDRDFVENVARALESVLKKEVNVSGPRYRPDRQNPSYQVSTMATDFGLWLKGITGDKARMPEVIKDAPVEYQLAFLRGFFDGNGYIGKSVSKKTGRLRYCVGACTAQLAFGEELAELMRGLGMTVWKPMMRKGFHKNSKMPVVHYRVNVVSFIRAGGRFSMQRKNERLDECIRLFPERPGAIKLKRVQQVREEPNVTVVVLPPVRNIERVERKNEAVAKIE